MGCSRPNLMHYNGFEYVFRGRRSQEVSFRERYLDAGNFPTYDIPCGKCELCRVSQRYSKALRIILEAESWPQRSYFITLTFDDKHLGNGELQHSEWSQFIKTSGRNFVRQSIAILESLPILSVTVRFVLLLSKRLSR